MESETRQKLSAAMESENEYEIRERRLLDKQLLSLESEPRSIKRSAVEGYIHTLQAHPSLFQERLSWVLNGSYGRGAYTRTRYWLELAKQSRKRKTERRPRWIVTALITLVGALEWGAPQSYTVRYWKKLTADDWQKLADIVNNELDEVENENRG